MSTPTGLYGSVLAPVYVSPEGETSSKKVQGMIRVLAPAMLENLTVWSYPPVIKVLPSGVNATQDTQP